MQLSLNVHPETSEFEAKVTTHAVGMPFTMLAIQIDNFRLTFFGKADDALKLIRVAKLLNEVFASEKVEAGE